MMLLVVVVVGLSVTGKRIVRQGSSVSELPYRIRWMNKDDTELRLLDLTFIETDSIDWYRKTERARPPLEHYIDTRGGEGTRNKCSQAGDKGPPIGGPEDRILVGEPESGSSGRISSSAVGDAFRSQHAWMTGPTISEVRMMRAQQDPLVSPMLGAQSVFR
jgi:hypothetical protein